MADNSRSFFDWTPIVGGVAGGYIGSLFSTAVFGYNGFLLLDALCGLVSGLVIYGVLNTLLLLIKPKYKSKKK